MSVSQLYWVFAALLVSWTGKIFCLFLVIMAHKPQFAAQCEQQLGTFLVLCEREGGVGGGGKKRKRNGAQL